MGGSNSRGITADMARPALPPEPAVSYALGIDGDAVALQPFLLAEELHLAGEVDRRAGLGDRLGALGFGDQLLVAGPRTRGAA